MYQIYLCHFDRAEGIVRSPKCFFVMFLFIWREVSWSFWILEVQILAHIFQRIYQILKLDLKALHELS